MYSAENPVKLRSCCDTCSGYIGAVTRDTEQTTEQTTESSTDEPAQTTRSTVTEPTGRPTGKTTQRRTTQPTTRTTTRGQGSAEEQGGDSGVFLKTLSTIL